MDPNGIYRAVLLALIFASYAVRQRGLRPGELVLVLTMSLYFAEGSGVAWGNLAWFLFAAAAGLLSLWLWQFVLLPYDPRRSLRNSVQAFYRRAAALVGAVDAGLAAAPASTQAAATAAEKDLARRLRQVKLSRRVIEEQFPGALAPGGWSKAQLSQLQLALFNTEQGLARLVEGANDPSHLTNLPAEIRTPLAAQPGFVAGRARRRQPGQHAGAGGGKRCAANRDPGVCERRAHERATERLRKRSPFDREALRTSLRRGWPPRCA